MAFRLMKKGIPSKSNLNVFFNLVTPPFLMRLIKFFDRRKSNLSYPTFETALFACKGNDYSSLQLNKTIFVKTINLEKKLKESNVLPLESLKSMIPFSMIEFHHQIKVLDFGGGAGLHRIIAQAALPATTEFVWRIVENESMTKIASQDSKNASSFFASIEEAAIDFGNIDLVIASGSLQYCPNPLYTLNQLVSLKARYLYLTRTPVTATSGRIITIQRSRLANNGPGPLPEGIKDLEIKYPITYVGKTDIESILKTQYKVRFTISEGSDTFRFRKTDIETIGYFCEILDRNV